MACSLSYIPRRLHSNGRPDIPDFFIGELLFRRCPPEIKDDPFGKISLIDLSVNRSGKSGSPISFPKDVLLNFAPTEKTAGVEQFNEEIVALELKEVNHHKTYVKSRIIQREITKGKNKSIDAHSCCICLKHKKIECNYSHCTFEVYFDGVEQTFENYSKSLGKHNSLKTWCKNEIAKMIIKEEVWINWPKI